MDNSQNQTPATTNFIKNIIENDLQTKRHTTIITRFPPEPNGYLHIGHAKSICLNFGLANTFNGTCNLRFDDTNPEKETEEYIQSIMNDVSWLGFKWHGEVKYASDYFDKLYECAEYLISQSRAYVCDLSFDEMKLTRGTLVNVGTNSPYRNRNADENLLLFRKMRDGEFEDGTKTLRLKIDMSSPNINMRDPIIYRIKKIHHIRTADKWCIYPMYDFTHCISDALENITHSCCTLEFADHRLLYDWIIHHLVNDGIISHTPRQIEFSRLELQYTVTSKRKLNELVVNNLVSGWDDPRMPTISGMRRRGYPKDGIHLFINRCGVSKSPNIMDLAVLESSVREVLEGNAKRLMAVLNPLKITLTNFDETIGSKKSPFHSKHENMGERMVELTREIYIEQDDFMETPIAKWQRLSLGGEVRLRHSYIIKCDEIIKDDNGNIIQLNCSIDKNTLGRNPEDRKVKGVIHWVSVTKSIPCIVRLYDRLFTKAEPDHHTSDFKQLINPNSLDEVNAYIEPAVNTLHPEEVVQFERLGYFVADRYDFNLTNKTYIFNKTVGLRDVWKN